MLTNKQINFVNRKQTDRQQDRGAGVEGGRERGREGEIGREGGEREGGEGGREEGGR